MEESRDGGRSGRAGASLQHQSTCRAANRQQNRAPGCRVAVLGGSEVLGCDGVQSQGAGDRGRPGSNAVALAHRGRETGWIANERWPERGRLHAASVDARAGRLAHHGYAAQRILLELGAASAAAGDSEYRLISGSQRGTGGVEDGIGGGGKRAQTRAGGFRRQLVLRL